MTGGDGRGPRPPQHDMLGRSADHGTPTVETRVPRAAGSQKVEEIDKENGGCYFTDFIGRLTWLNTFTVYVSLNIYCFKSCSNYQKSVSPSTTHPLATIPKGGAVNTGGGRRAGLCGRLCSEPRLGAPPRASGPRGPRGRRGETAEPRHCPSSVGPGDPSSVQGRGVVLTRRDAEKHTSQQSSAKHG